LGLGRRVTAGGDGGEERIQDAREEAERTASAITDSVVRAERRATHVPQCLGSSLALLAVLGDIRTSR
jgi:hypothetical protein